MAASPKVESATLPIKRYFTKDSGDNPYDHVTWSKRTARLTGADGSIVFEQEGVEAPDSWSDQAVNVVASKYFRGTLGTPERESSVKQLISRVVATIADWALRDNYFDVAHSQIFYNELKYLLLHQMAAFNSPVYFNVGIEPKPQCSACFILAVEDDMESILQWYRNEGMIFKHGSGSGVNVSKIRSSHEGLRGGGTASGPLSFMKAADASAGVIQSGGKTRRAAKMVVMDAEHPDIFEFVRCKAEEEKKAWALIDAGYDGSLDGEAYKTVAYQHANHSVRVTDEFMKAVERNGLSELTDRVTRFNRFIPARDLFRAIAESAHLCGDPGMQFDDEIQKWHTCPNAGRISASNPCQPGMAPVLTPEGIRTFDDVDVGSTIWSGSRWTQVTRKIATGDKPVLKYVTRAGSFIGTKDHQVVVGEVKLPVWRVSQIRRVRGESFHPDTSIISQIVMDGLVFGDGQNVAANGGANNYQVLHIGRGDTDYFVEPGVDDLISHNYDGTAYVVLTNIEAEELPRTYERKIPTRYFQGTFNVVRSFLRGLYSANGSVCGGRVTLKAASLMVIEQVQMMLSALGIASYYTVNQAHDNQFSNGVYFCRESYDLNITSDRGLFAELIGFIQSSKLAKLSKALKLKSRPWEQHDYDIVDRIELGEMPVFDITVDDPAHTYWTGGLLVSNCSEYMHLDNSACNLASLNLIKFVDADGNFLIEDFQRAVSLLITAQDILVDNASYPTPEIEKNAHDYRQLGLGYANLGAMLMRLGIPYDSDQGRDMAAAVTSLMTAQAYLQSSRLAAVKGPFNGYEADKDGMLDVLSLHEDASDKLPLHTNIVTAACATWDDATEHASVHGVRNSQTVVIAPTGTIAFMMDCDTTGIEPDIALVKHKKLVGGGELRIVNQQVVPALERLGYQPMEIKAIQKWIAVKGAIERSLLKDEHLPVFDCAFKPVGGTRTIAWQAHLKMVAAVQPFVSGSISKTINMPAESTVEDIEEAYMMAWRLKCKAVAIYRDGSKRTQPLNAGNTKVEAAPAAAPLEHRRKLADTRASITHKFDIAGHEGYITVGMYEDGTPGEVFVSMSKQGSTISGLIDSFAIAVSFALQYGVPLSFIVKKFSHARFEPSGFTKNPEIPHAKSVIDYLARWLASKFLPKQEQIDIGNQVPQIVHLPQEEVDARIATFVNQADAPPCPDCGCIMVRNGACYKCLNCGTSSGCS